jgi:hypothetical protein
MDHVFRLIDRASLFAAVRHALDQYQWLVGPDFDQEGEVQAAETLLAAQAGTPLLAAAYGLRQWVTRGPGGNRCARRWSASGSGSVCCAIPSH